MNKLLFFLCGMLSVISLSAQQSISAAEYYIGTNDPGAGNATPLFVVDGAFNEAIEAVFRDSVWVNAADSNFIFNIRAQDQQGQWGPVFTKAMHWSPLPNPITPGAGVLSLNNLHLSAAEYFFGSNDPGEGNATPILAQDGNFNEAIEALFRSSAAWGNLPNPSLFNIRARDGNGIWGPLFRKVIVPTGSNNMPNLITEGDSLHICENLPVTLHYIGPNAFSLQWFNNSVADSITFVPAQSGYYAISAQQGSEYYTDSIYIQVHPIAASIIAADTLRICGTAYTLQADTGAYTYAWNTGAINTTSLNITQSGWYSCTYANISCSRKDSVFVSLLAANIVQGDTSICPGNTVSLTAQNSANEINYLYANAFETNPGASWNNIKQFAFNGSQVMGPYSNEVVSYQSGTIPTHDSLLIEFDFYPHDTWDNGEPFQFSLNGNVVSTAYFYYYNGTCTDSRFQATGNVANRCTNWYPYYTQKYHAVFRVPHTQNNVQFSINQWSGEDVCNESWSFDNFTVGYRSPRQYTWSSGATGAQTTVSPAMQTTYTVSLSDGIGVCTDTIRIDVDTFTAHLFVADTLLNCLSNQMLSVATGYSSYLWMNGDTLPNTPMIQSGYYWCRVSDGLCYAYDTTYVSYPGAHIVASSTQLCAEDTLQLLVEIPGISQLSNQVIPAGQTWYSDSIRTPITGNNIAGSTQIGVQQSTGLQVGDVVLMVVMQDNASNGYNNIGHYETHRITSILGNTLMLDSALQYTYSDQNGMRCQLIRVPMYEKLTIEGTLSCHAWNGQTGGVLCVYARNGLSIQSGGLVEANGKGFRGGDGVSSGGGNQGESIYGTGTLNYTNNAGGGGGGNCHPSHGQGGGGGGYANSGYYGSQYNWYYWYWCNWYWCGCSYEWCGYNYSGYAGNNITVSTDRLVPGSGGGSGGYWYGNPYYPYVGYGGNGGGAILLLSDTISGSGSVQCKGQDGNNANYYNYFGGGGAGSGGQIATKGLASSIITNISGGIGGRSGDYVTQGGNGSQGRLTTHANYSIQHTSTLVTWSTGSHAMNLAYTLQADTNFICSVTDGISTCADTVHITVNPLPSAIINADTIRVCAATYSIEANNGFSTYSWSTGDHTQTTMVNSTGWYFCTVTNANGCSATDSVFVSLINGGIQTPDTTICWGNSIGLQIAANSSYQSISWSSGGALSTEWVSPLQNTVYTCTVTNAYHTCVDTVQITVSHPDVQVAMGTPTVLCSGNSLTLQGTGAMAYSWTPSVQNGLTFTPSVGTTTYTVTGMDAYGCVNTATHILTVNPSPSPAITASSTVFCYGLSASLSGLGATNYAWAPAISLSASNGNQVTATPLQTTTYTVTGTNAYGCSASASITLMVKPQPTVMATGNLNYCNGQSVAAVALTGSPANVSFDISGGAARGMPNQSGVTSLPAFTAGPVGSSFVSIIPKANGCTGPAYTYSLGVSNCSPVTLNTKFYLQGYYTGAGQMQPVLYNQGAISSPSIPYCDYVVVELHEPTPPYAIAKTSLATLKTNGTLQCSFPGSVTGNSYYLVLNHRNTLSTWSSSPVQMQTTTNYDFSNAANKVYGNNQILLEPGIFGFYSADINQDENIDLLDLGILETDVLNFESGYLGTDINGDGNVDLLDFPTAADNITNFIYSFHP